MFLSLRSLIVAPLNLKNKYKLKLFLLQTRFCPCPRPREQCFLRAERNMYTYVFQKDWLIIDKVQTKFTFAFIILAGMDYLLNILYSNLVIFCL